MTASTRTRQETSSWVVCRKCRELVYGPRFLRELSVCPECGWHGPLGAVERTEQLLDEGSWKTLACADVEIDPLEFVDSKPYPHRLAQARERTGLDEAVLCAVGTVEGHTVVTAVMDFRFMGGSLGAGVGEAITAAAETALAQQAPLLIVSASGGARMQEGAIALMQMAKTCDALTSLDEAGVLTVSLVTDPTYGGVAASYATACDVVLAEPGARMGFAGPRVIEQTIRQELPEGFQVAESLSANGLVDGIVPRSLLRPTLARLLSMRSASPAVLPQAADPLVRDPRLLPERDPWSAVLGARELERPTTLDYISVAVDGFVELHGDRTAADCSAIVGGVGRLGGLPVMVIGTEKGHTPRELGDRNFAMATPPGYRKAVRLMRLAGKLDLPVVTLIDTPGAYPGVEAEEQGQALRIAESLSEMARLPVPTVAVVTGEGGSGGALALGLADRVILSENGTYSVISPEGCAAILWNDRSAASQAAERLGLEARELLRLGVVDAVLPEPRGGAHQDRLGAGAGLRDALVCTLRDLLAQGPDERRSQRRTRFRRFGAIEPTAREEAAR
ncbi:acetyl-CoA carboxylase carboxyl transferase subunit alpha [Streptomonospora arabica]|uniref:Multifunctional fusion protein n=1 Tax=Streptomonospora arabica TaxID=412417 RepID=A0ABV9SG94_9ACTN